MRRSLHGASAPTALLLAVLAPDLAAQNCGGPVLAPSLEAGDRYGEAVDWRGSVAVVGAPGSDAAAPGAGAVHVLEHLGTGYFAHAAQLLAPAPIAGEALGSAVALAPGRIVAGAPGAGTGRAHVFVLAGGSWTHEQELASGGSQPGERLGAAVAIDAGWIALGAPLADDGGFAGAGRVRMYELSGGVWVERGSVAAPDPNAAAGFGASVALSGDALLVGAPGNDHAGTDSGAAYVFERSGASWVLAGVLHASDAAASQRFGAAAALDGELAAVGAPGDSAGRGAIYAFDELAGTWTEDAKIGGAGAGFDPGDGYGSAVDVESDASGPDTIVGGAPGADLFGGDDHGLVVGYSRGVGSWIFLGSGAAADGLPGDGFGLAVALEGNGALGGAPRHDSVGARGGSVYGFTFLGDCFSSTAICSGDGGGAACPCGNTGLPGDGCENSAGHGGTLQSWGFPSLSSDTLAFGAWNLLPGQPALLFVGDMQLNGGNGLSFGDGLRCVGQNVVRLGVRTPDAHGYAEWGPGVATQTGAPAFSTRFFQVWYRDPSGGPCASGFNLTNAWVRTLTF